MTISQINAACAPYEVTGRTTLGTVYNQTQNARVHQWIQKCIQHEGCDYNTDLNEIEEICGWKLCPFEGERLAQECGD